MNTHVSMFFVVEDNTYGIYGIALIYVLNESNLDKGFEYLGAGNLLVHKLLLG